MVYKAVKIAQIGGILLVEVISIKKIDCEVVRIEICWSIHFLHLHKEDISAVFPNIIDDDPFKVKAAKCPFNAGSTPHRAAAVYIKSALIDHKDCFQSADMFEHLTVQIVSS